MCLHSWRNCKVELNQDLNIIPDFAEWYTTYGVWIICFYNWARCWPSVTRFWGCRQACWVKNKHPKLHHTHLNLRWRFSVSITPVSITECPLHAWHCASHCSYERIEQKGYLSSWKVKLQERKQTITEIIKWYEENKAGKRAIRKTGM